jgi:hypothetical protein
MSKTGTHDSVERLHGALAKQLLRFYYAPSLVTELARRLFRKTGWGSHWFRTQIGAVSKPGYAWCMWQAAILASRLGISRISVIEFGVGSGNGCAAMEDHARAIEKRLGVRLDLFGFDTGSGLPVPQDYRDLPYWWQPGFYPAPQDALRRYLSRVTIFWGDVEETLPRFVSTKPAPLGAVFFDLDYYSSTVKALKIFSSSVEHLPRVLCYFDDTMDSAIEVDGLAICPEFYCGWTGELAAIHEFNENNKHMKISLLRRHKYHVQKFPWFEKVYVLHDFSHPQYCEFVSPRPSGAY